MPSSPELRANSSSLTASTGSSSEIQAMPIRRSSSPQNAVMARVCARTAPYFTRVSSFVEKNRDALFPHVYDVLHESSDSLIQACFPEREEVQSKKETVANKYLAQLVRTRRPLP